MTRARAMGTRHRRTPWRALLAVLAATTTAGLAAAAALPLPRLFPGSDAVLWGVLAGLLALGLAMMLPDRHLHSPHARLLHAFRTRHGVGQGRAEHALETASEVHERADRLRAAAADLEPEAARRATAIADRLDGLARAVFYDPARLSAVQPVASRSELVVEAAEGVARLAREAGGDMATPRAADDLAAALDALAAAFDDLDRRRALGVAQDVSVASQTAELLLSPPSGRARAAAPAPTPDHGDPTP